MKKLKKGQGKAKTIPCPSLLTGYASLINVICKDRECIHNECSIDACTMKGKILTFSEGQCLNKEKSI